MEFLVPAGSDSSLDSGLPCKCPCCLMMILLSSLSPPLFPLLSFFSLSFPLFLLSFLSSLSSLLFSPLPSPCNCCCLNKVTLNCLFLRSWISDKLWEWQPGVWRDPPWLGPSVNLLPAPIFASSRVQNGGGEIFSCRLLLSGWLSKALIKTNKILHLEGNNNEDQFKG